MKASLSFVLTVAYLFFLPLMAKAQISGCQTEVDAIENCVLMNDSPSNAQRCVACLTTTELAPIEPDTCSAAGTTLCGLLDKCPTCAIPACVDEFQAGATCAAQNVNGLDDCTVECNSSAALSFAWWTAIVGVVGVSWMILI